MGQTLSEPVTTKVSDSGEDDRHYYGASSMQGWRVSMEDSHSAVLNLCPESDKHISWFAVYDGHGGKKKPWRKFLGSNLLLGDRVARYSGENVHLIVKKQEPFETEEYITALQDGFVATDTALLEGKHSATVFYG